MQEGSGWEGYDEAPILRIANTILETALERQVRDILIEPSEAGVLVKYRAEDSWEEVMNLPLYIRGPLTARFKVMADLFPMPNGKAQQGRIPVRYHDRDFTMIVRTEPTRYGENLNLTIEEELKSTAD